MMRCWRSCNGPHRAMRAWLVLRPFAIDAHTHFEGALIPLEAQFLRRYEELGEHGCVSLHSDPDQRFMATKGKDTLYCVIRKNHPLYSIPHHRWLVPRETLATNTYVVYGGQSQHGETTSFMFDRASFGFPPRARHHMFFQAGDGMSLPSIGVALLWMLMHPLLPRERDAMKRSIILSCFVG